MPGGGNLRMMETDHFAPATMLLAASRWRLVASRVAVHHGVA
jgi:hypothetical protein